MAKKSDYSLFINFFFNSLKNRIIHYFSGPQYSLFINFLAHYSLFIIKKGHYSLIIIPHLDPHIYAYTLNKHNGKNQSHFLWILDFTWTKRVRRSNINLSKSKFWHYLWAPCEDGLVMYDFYKLPLPRVCLFWQTAQTLIRRRVLWRLIWVYAVCICFLFECIQLVSHVRTLNFRLATPLCIFFSQQRISD